MHSWNSVRCLHPRAQSIGKPSVDFVAFGVACKLKALQYHVLAFLAPLKHYERRASAMCVLCFPETDRGNTPPPLQLVDHI